MFTIGDFLKQMYENNSISVSQPESGCSSTTWKSLPDFIKYIQAPKQDQNSMLVMLTFMPIYVLW